MARQIIILETNKAGDGYKSVNTVMWFPIAASNARVPRPGFVSRASSLTGADAITQTEQTALEDGSVREEASQSQYPDTATNNEIKADLVKRFSSRSTAIAAEPATRQFYGVSYNGSAWSA
jgi:hypothetical protein